MRRSSMKFNPVIVQRTEANMIITIVSILAGSSPAACACTELYTKPDRTVRQNISEGWLPLLLF